MNSIWVVIHEGPTSLALCAPGTPSRSVRRTSYRACHPPRARSAAPSLSRSLARPWEASPRAQSANSGQNRRRLRSLSTPTRSSARCHRANRRAQLSARMPCRFSSRQTGRTGAAPRMVCSSSTSRMPRCGATPQQRHRPLHNSETPAPTALSHPRNQHGLITLATAIFCCSRAVS